MKIIDNWLDPYLVDYLNQTFLYQYPHIYKESSTNIKNMFYSYDFSPGKNTVIEYIKHKLFKTFFDTQRIKFDRVYFNVQHPGMNGSFHTDTDSKDGKTALIMITPKDAEGSFVYKKENVIKEIEYRQNKLIIFNGNIPHYGKAFVSNPRITLAFKISLSHLYKQ